MRKVFGTMEVVPNIEINHNTVYIRTNVVSAERDGLQGWEYDEERISKDTFIERLQIKNALLEERLEISEIAIDFLLMGGM